MNILRHNINVEGMPYSEEVNTQESHLLAWVVHRVTLVRSLYCWHEGLVGGGSGDKAHTRAIGEVLP